ncbi:unnamed protein product [Brassica rapa subsp. trilocularis]
MVNLQRQRKKIEEKHELEEEIGGSENSFSASSENSSAPSNPPETSPAPSEELVSVVGFDHRRIRNQSGNSQI